jgi:hypothetical protein
LIQGSLIGPEGKRLNDGGIFGISSEMRLTYLWMKLCGFGILSEYYWKGEFMLGFGIGFYFRGWSFEHGKFLDRLL